MKVQFYGVRGSTPTPGKDTVEFGGNTSCVYVELSNNKSIILDAGTGIISLGKRLSHTDDDIYILLTHNHWDHIQGFPYFQPIHQVGRKITLISGAVDHYDKDLVLKQMSGSAHPVKYQQLAAKITLNTSISSQNSFSINAINVTTKRLNHPDGGTAYCLTADNKKLAYVTDNELIPPGHVNTSWQEWIEFVANADILIHDAQYTCEDLPLKHGWGHSTFNQVAELAIQAKVKKLYIISHDPLRTDAQLLSQEKLLQQQYGERLSIQCAREGQSVEISD